MIVGIGSDLIDIRRVESALERHGDRFRDRIFTEVEQKKSVNAPSGKPTMHLTGGAAKQLQKLLPAGTRAAIHLTITDDFPLAQAFVIIEALPETE